MKCTFAVSGINTQNCPADADVMLRWREGIRPGWENVTERVFCNRHAEGMAGSLKLRGIPVESRKL